MATIQNVGTKAIIANINSAASSLNASILNLSSGVKQNASISDLSVGTLLRNQSSALTTANTNIGQGKSLLETAKGGLNEILGLLQSQKALAVKAEDSSLTSNERSVLQTEFAALTTEIDRLANTTKFNNKNLLDGSISGTANLSTKTSQSTENYTLIDTTHYSFSGTTVAGELDSTATETFAAVTSANIGKTAGSATLSFVDGSMTDATNAVVQINGVSVTFSATGASSAARGIAAATNFVAAAEALTDNSVRSFTFKDNGDGTVLVTSADLGTAANGLEFQLTNRGGGFTANTVTFGGDNIDTVGAGTAEDFDSVTTKITTGANRAPTSATVDAGLEGAFSKFTASLDTSGTQNTVTFTVDINNTTYTANPVTLFGTGGFNSKGNTIKNGQLLTFYNTGGPTDAAGEYTDNGFTLKVDDALGATDDIVIAGGTQAAFETDLTSTASGFLTQLVPNRINQARDVILPEVNPTGGDFDISAAVGTTFAGIEGYDAEGVNATGDIRFVGDQFGDDGKLGAIGSFAFDSTTHKLTATIGGEVYTSDLSDSTANTGGIVNGAGSYNSTTKKLTAGAGTIIVMHSAATNDGRQLRIDLTNITDKTIELDTTANAKTVTDDLDTLFGVSSRESLSFQVGTSATNKISVSVNSAKTTDIYLNDAGTSKTLNISTTAGATEAQDVLDNAIDSVLGLLSSVSSGITSFDSATAGNNTMIQNLDTASGALLNTDYATESTRYAEAALKINAAISILAQEQSRTEGILTLLR